MNRQNSAMPWITATVLAAFVAYIGAWYFGVVEGNFALVLFLTCVVTGLYWLAERFYFLPQRQKTANALSNNLHTQRSDLAQKGLQSDNINIEQARTSILAQPWWLDWTAGLFPVILVVFLLRSFCSSLLKSPRAP